jgi:hypothetical protein
VDECEPLVRGACGVDAEEVYGAAAAAAAGNVEYDDNDNPAGACTRPLLSSTWAVYDTNTPPNTPWHLVNAP